MSPEQQLGCDYLYILRGHSLLGETGELIPINTVIQRLTERREKQAQLVNTRRSIFASLSFMFIAVFISAIAIGYFIAAILLFPCSLYVMWHHERCRVWLAAGKAKKPLDMIERLLIAGAIERRWNNKPLTSS